MTSAGKYKKQDLVGSSQDVDVFQGFHIDFGRSVAIKELRGGVNTGENLREAFFRDYENWAQFDHPRLVRVEEIDRTRARSVQEYLPESILDRSELIRQNPELGFDYLQQILEGLQYLHEQGFLHCNLKASNIRFTGERGDGAKLCDGRCVPVGKTGLLPKPKGSSKYLAPEMINEEFGTVGFATDLYVAGFVMLEALASQEFDGLFKGFIVGTPDPEMGWVRWHNSPETIDPVQTSLPSVPGSLAKLLDGLLCKQVHQRIGNASDALAELEAARKEWVESPTVGDPAKASGTPSSAPPRPDSAPSMAPAPDDEPKLISRPDSPVYIRIASGELSGTIVPLELDDVLIGEKPECQVRIPPEQYPNIRGREVLVQLGANGWQISDRTNNSVIVGTTKHFQPTAIKSGDIFRLSSSGPDFQFVVQGENDWTWSDVASELKISRPKGDSKSKPKAAAPAAPAPPAPAAPPKAAPPAAAPLAASATGQPSGAGRSGGAPVAAPTPPPAAPAAAQAAAKPVEKKPSKKPKPAPKQPVAAAPSNPAQDGPAKPSLVQQFQAMDKDKRNKLILIVGLAVMSVLIILFMPQVESEKDKQEREQKTEEVSSDDGKNGNGQNDVSAESGEPPADDAAQENDSSDEG